MNKKTILAGILAGVVTFLLNWLLYGIALAEVFENLAGTASGVMKNDAEMASSIPYLIIGQLVYGLFIAYILGHWASVSTPAGGAKAGATIGVLVSVAINFTSLGTYNILTLNGALADVAVMTVVSALAGAAAGWWLGRK
jgi:hypothetical protein